MRVFLFLIVVLLSGLFLLNFGLTGRLVPGLDRTPPPNVMFILVDTLRGDRIDATRNGVPVMPNLAALARESRSFTHAIAPASWTRPSMASLMTGLPMEQHGVEYINRTPGEATAHADLLAKEHETLAEFLKEASYNTFGLVTNGNVQPGTGFQQGYDTYTFLDYAKEEGAANEVTDAGLAALDTLKPPFLFYLHYMDPHGPYDAPPPHDSVFGEIPQPSLTDAPIFESKESFTAYLYQTARLAAGLDVLREFPPISDAGKEHMRARYDEECHFADAQIARAIAEVRRRYPDTLIVLTADHGEEFWEHAGMGHGTTLFEEQVNVPLLINGPKVVPASVSETVGSIGIAKTITRYLGLEPRPMWHGEDLLVLPATPSPAYTGTKGSDPDWGIDLNGLVDGETKAIHNRSKDAMMLFDLAEDPHEQNNLADNRADDAAAYRKKLEDHRQHAEERAYHGGETAVLDAETRAQMEALGYLKADDAPKDKSSPAPTVSPVSSAEPKKPNVVVVVIDTLRADRLHAVRNGVPVMPYLSEWANNNWQFTQATSQSSWTKPSVVSLMSSLYVQSHRVEFGTQQEVVSGQSKEVQMVPPELDMMAEAFKAAGYATGAVVANVHLRPDYNFNQGFDEYHYQVSEPAALITNTALEMMQRLPEPWFLYVHYLDPHAPYQPPEPFKSDFGDVPAFTPAEQQLMLEEYHRNYYLDKVLFDVGLRRERQTEALSDSGREAIRYLYDGECRYTDAEVKRFFDALEATGAPTYRVLTADHGEEFWEHGSIGHSKTLYQELVNVPLIISGPGISPGTSNVPVELIDVMPTLADRLDLPKSRQWQGRSLLPQATPYAEKPVYSQTRMSVREFGVELESIRDGDWKLVLDHGTPAELFNLAADPGESTNLLAENSDRVKALAEKHAAHLATCKAHPAAQKPPPLEGLTPEMQEELENLGYLGVDPPAPPSDCPKGTEPCDPES